MLKILLKQYVLTIMLLSLCYLAILIIFTGNDGLLMFIKQEWAKVIFWLHMPIIIHLTIAYHEQKKQLKI